MYILYLYVQTVTRQCFCFPNSQWGATAHDTKLFWENFIRHYGFPEKFLSDQGRNFESELISELCKLAQVEKVHTTPYHPMTNGQCVSRRCYFVP